MQALDASEVRKRLAENGEFTVNDILDDEDDWEAMVDDAPTNANESAEASNTALSAEKIMENQYVSILKWKMQGLKMLELY